MGNSKMQKVEVENFWTTEAFKALVGKRIISVRYMTDTEARDFGWKQRPLVIELDNGERFCPAYEDDSGNASEGGCLYKFKANACLPWLDPLEES